MDEERRRREQRRGIRAGSRPDGPRREGRVRVPGPAILLAGWMLWGGTAPARARDVGEVRVDRVAVVVEGYSARDRDPQVATVWDLFVAAQVDAIRRRGPDAAAASVDADALRSAQRVLIERLIVLREAARLGHEGVSPGVVDEARDALAERLGGHDALRAFLRDRSIPMESLERDLRREAVASRFARTTVRVAAQAEPAALRSRFEAGGHPFDGASWEESAEAFAAWEAGERWEEARRAWLVDLRRRCRLGVFDVVDELEPARGRE
jgi:hypothetical protein